MMQPGKGGDSHSWPPAAPCSARCDWHEVRLRGARRCGHDWRGWSWARWSTAFALAPSRSVWSAYECACRRRSSGYFSFRLPLSRCPWPFQPFSVLLWGCRKDTKNKTRETVGYKKRKTSQPQMLQRETTYSKQRNSACLPSLWMSFCIGGHIDNRSML